MSLVSCVTSFAPFQDPADAADIELLLTQFQQRIDVECERGTCQPPATPFERHPFHLQFLLECTNYDLEQSVQRWIAWVGWRHEVGAEEIATDDVGMRNEVEARLASWTEGQDRTGRRCLVITGRHLDPSSRRAAGADARSFQVQCGFQPRTFVCCSPAFLRGN
jgi:hypothetical protein